jgi:hypothetical protein
MKVIDPQMFHEKSDVFADSQLLRVVGIPVSHSPMASKSEATVLPFEFD